jgi:hypothetical protein
LRVLKLARKPDGRVACNEVGKEVMLQQTLPHQLESEARLIDGNVALVDRASGSRTLIFHDGSYYCCDDVYAMNLETLLQAVMSHTEGWRK